jgi:hypothetical protein
MMSDFAGVDFFKEAQLSTGKVAVPPGIYVATIMTFEKNKSRNNDDKLDITFDLGKEYFQHTESFNLWHSTSEQAKKISEEQLSRLAKAVGFENSWPDSFADFVGKQLRVVVKQSPGSGQYADKMYTNIVGYMPLEDESSTSNTPDSGGSAVGGKPRLRG